LKPPARKPSPGIPLYRLVFRSECLPVHEPAAVRAAVTAALQLDERRAAKLFSGQRVVVRRKLDEATALRYAARFAELGARLRTEPEPPPRWRPEFEADFLGALDPAGPKRWGPLQVLALAVLGGASATAVGLLIGPGLLSWRESASMSTAAAPPPAASAAPHQPASPPWVAAPMAAPVLPPAAAVASAPQSGADPLASLTAPALRDYRQIYAFALRHKAFAVSAAGAYGWVSAMGTAEEARVKAEARCRAESQKPNDPCKVIDLDGVVARR
jgi:hypothetical protein